MLWRRPDTTDQGLSAFLRLAGSPSDRNLVNFYVDGGLTFKGLFPGRSDDILGLGLAYARISGGARGFDRDTVAFSGQAQPVRDYEAVLELTYVAPITPWLTLQPDFQYIFHPSANSAIAQTGGGFTTAGDAAIFGLRSTIVF
jgi:porin